MSSKTKVLVLIDGFNYYHKVKSYQKNNKICVKWLDYMRMVETSFKDYRKYDEYEIDVIYFSAFAQFRGEAPVRRHKTYIKALEYSGVKVILGEFKEKGIEPCADCTQKMPNEKIIRHEEKHTDVNIAVTLLEKAFKDEFDDAYLLSEDNDYVPVVKKVKELFPQKSTTICPPPQKYYAVDALLKASKESDYYRFKWNQIKHYQFPDNYNGLENPWKI